MRFFPNMSKNFDFEVREDFKKNSKKSDIVTKGR